MGGNSVGIFACCVILLLCTVNNVNSYSKYGRGCQDIGCLPSEECVISQDSCSYSQREGKDCGNFPTCKKKYGASSSSASVPVNPSGTGLKTGFESNIFSLPSASSASSSSSSASMSASSSATGSAANVQNYYNHNNGNNNNNAGGMDAGGTSLGSSINGIGSTNNQNQNLATNNNKNANKNNHNNNNGNGNINPNNGSPIDPHYVFGAPHVIPMIPNMPIFPYNAPTSAPSFQQFPQPNHPGSIYSPSFPSGIQPVNPFNPSFVFGSQPFYSPPGGTGGPPNSNGGGLAPYYGGNGFQQQQPNMFHKPPPQYQNQNQYPNSNQNTYNRQTQQPHHRYSSAIRIGGNTLSNFGAVITLSCVTLIFNMIMQQWSFENYST